MKKFNIMMSLQMVVQVEAVSEAAAIKIAEMAGTNSDHKGHMVLLAPNTTLKSTLVEDVCEVLEVE